MWEHPNVTWAAPDQLEAKLDTFLVGHGFAGVHVPNVGGGWFDVTITHRDYSIPSSATDPDPRAFETLEFALERLTARGGFAYIWQWGDSSRGQTPQQLPGGQGGAVDDRLNRYLAARLGPLPGWALGYGFDVDEWTSLAELSLKNSRDAMVRAAGAA